LETRIVLMADNIAGFFHFANPSCGGAHTPGADGSPTPWLANGLLREARKTPLPGGGAQLDTGAIVRHKRRPGLR